MAAADNGRTEVKGRSADVARVLVLLSASAAVVFAVGVWRGALERDGYPDFDQYWYGGLVERTPGGSYTDTRDVLARAATDDRTYVTQDDVYGPPALIALFFVPASALPVETAGTVFLALAAVALALALRHATGTAWPFLFLLVALMPVTKFALALGQPSLVTASFLVAAYGCVRRGEERAAGALVGIAGAWKLYPAFAIIAFAVRRQWSAVSAAAVTLAVAAVATVAILGPSHAWLAASRTLSVGSGVSAYPQNQSVPGVLLRLTGNDSLALVTSLALAAGGGYVLHRWRSSPPDAVFAAAILITLLAQPIAWNHYAIAAIPALVAVTQRERRGVAAVGLAGIGVALLVWPHDVVDIGTSRGLEALTSAWECAGVSALLGALSVSIHNRRSPARLR